MWDRAIREVTSPKTNRLSLRAQFLLSFCVYLFAGVMDGWCFLFCDWGKNDDWGDEFVKKIFFV